MAEEFPPARWGVPGVVPQGLTIQAGKPKLGKSFMVLGWGFAVASGDRAFGKIPVKAGDVLYLALEDSGRRLQSRLRGMLGEAAAPERLQLETVWPRSNEGGLDRLRAWLDVHPEARLIVIDTLARFRPITKEQSGYSQDYAAIEPLQALAAEHDIAIVVVHHQRKMAAADWLDTISGTLGLAGAADGMLGLFRDRESPDALMRITGRDVEDAKLGLRFDPTTTQWTLKDAAQVGLSPERVEIREALRAAGPIGMEPHEVAEDLHKNDSTIRTLLQKMLDQEQVDFANGRYVVLT